MSDRTIHESAPFAALLRRYRAAAHLTQEQLAARAGLSSDAIAALERGKRRTPRGATIELLAAALGLDEGERAQFIAAAHSAAAPAPVGSTVRGEAHAATGVAASAWLALAQPSPLVDRVEELDAIIQLLTVEGARMLTLTGPAGVGKTRLALAAAAQLEDPFRDGIVFVDLTPIRDSEMALNRLAAAIGLLDMGSRSLVDRLLEALRQRRQLLVLDNFEQVLPAATHLADLLAVCPGVSLLVTSRVPLQLRWERTLRLAPLPVPDLTTLLPPLDELLAVPSVALFVQRARHHQAEFALGKKHGPLVARLTAQLDGLPLALELAAARTATLSLPALVTRLGDRLHLLRWEAPDVPVRQQSLEAAVGWSYDLLSEEERRLFRCLGVFVGRVSLDAVAAVAHAVAAVDDGVGVVEGGVGDTSRALHGLLSLAQQSLILPVRPADIGWVREWSDAGDPVHDEEDVELTFGMLETVRAYAEERLTAEGELAAARRAHAHYFLALAERADSQLRGCDQRIWILRLEREQDNLRAALRWLLDQDNPAERALGLRLAGALGTFWVARGYHSEGVRWLQEALARAHREQEREAADRTRALVFAGGLLTLRGEFVQARAALEEALALAEQREDLASMAKGYTFLGMCAVFAGGMAEGIRLLEEAVRRWEAAGDRAGLGETLLFRGVAAAATRDNAATTAYYAAALDQLEAAGDANFAGFVRCYLGVAQWERGELSRAMKHIQAAVRSSNRMRDRYLLALAAQAAAVVGAGADPARRARLLGAADALTHATGATFVWARTPAGQDVARLRERLAQVEGEDGAAYQEGRALPFGGVADLILQLLTEITLAPPLHEVAPGDAQPLATPAPRPAERNPLTEREREVLRLVAQGHSSKAIGQRLFLSPSTVNHHVQSIFNKLGVDTRAQAVAVATQRQLL